MQKLLNDPAAFVDEMLAGVVFAHPSELRLSAERALVRADAPIPGKVGIATGGGSGHLPLFLGYVGSGLADGAAIGNVFSSPSAEQMLAVTRAVDGGAGVLHLYGNYGGDVLNFELAAELAAADGIEVATVLGTDDVASAPRGSEASRRGVGGIFFLYKAAGARAAEGGSLEDVASATQKAAANVRTMGVGLAPCIIPAAGTPTFELGDGEMEIGIGIHGEPGVRRGPLESADRVGEDLTGAVLADLPFVRGDEVAVLVNGLGATPREELYILYRRVHELLSTADLRVHRVWVGEFATSLEMAGASLTLLRLDDELKRLVDAPARSPFLTEA